MSKRNRNKGSRRKSDSMAAITPNRATYGHSTVDDKSVEHERAAFVDTFMSHCQNKYGLSGFVYDPDKFRITDSRGDNYSMSLHNLYADYSTSTNEGRLARMDEYAKAWVADHSMPSSFAEAKERLYPVVKNRWEADISLLKAPGEGGGRELSRPLTNNLVIGVVYEHPTLVHHVGTAALEDWGVDADAVFQSAMENLRVLFMKRAMHQGAVPLEQFGAAMGCDADQLLAMMNRFKANSFPSIPSSTPKSDIVVAKASLTDLGFGELEFYPGVFTQTEEDWFSPSRILLPDWINTVPVKGEPIVLIPKSGRLLVTGSDDPAGLQAMAKIAKDFGNTGHPVSSIPVRLTAEGWQTYQPEQGHPAYSALRELYSRETGSYYNGQNGVLAKRFPGFIAPCFLVDVGGTAATVCTWTKGVSDGLLPKTDYVTFVIVNLEEMTAQVVPAFVPWEAVMEIAGHLMEPTDYSPPRFRIRTFPSDDEIVQLVAKGIPMPPTSMTSKGATP